MSEHAILLFDGVCNMCNDAVRFVIAHDPKGYFRFAPLQSAIGHELLARCGQRADALDTMVLVEGERCSTRSDAAVRIVRHLSGAWPLLALLRFLPQALRDRGYRWVADNRYAWFGKRDACAVPTPELRARFLA